MNKTTMNILPVLRFPDPRLRKVAEKITSFNKEVSQIVDSMYVTMKNEKGVGLAATQVNIHKRIIVTDCREPVDEGEKSIPNPIEFINPEIISKSTEINIYEEGCLSVPEFYADVERANQVEIKAFDKNGKEFTMICSDLLATCIQHEIDHLNGKLFIDYLSPIKRNLVREKMKKYEKKLLDN